MDTGPEQVTQEEERQQLLRQSRVVYAKSFIAAAILTAIALVL